MKKNIFLLLAAIAHFSCTETIAQSNRTGANRTTNQTAKADSVRDVSDEVLLLELYRGARVTDVVDGMATVGYLGVGNMNPKIAPLWRNTDDMSHRFAGIAVTARYGPTNRPMHPGADLTKPENYH